MIREVKFAEETLFTMDGEASLRLAFEGGRKDDRLSDSRREALDEKEQACGKGVRQLQEI